MDKKAYFMGFTVPPSIEEVQALADEILDELPQDLLKRTKKLKVTVEDFPDAFIEKELGLEDQFSALGVYQSASPTAIGHLGAGAKSQDTLYLYRRPILDAWCETGEDLTLLVNQVILREIGYHFGFSEDQIDMYEESLLGSGTQGFDGEGG